VAVEVEDQQPEDAGDGDRPGEEVDVHGVPPVRDGY
jgi:hypothetical protein